MFFWRLFDKWNAIFITYLHLNNKIELLNRFIFTTTQSRLSIQRVFDIPFMLTYVLNMYWRRGYSQVLSSIYNTYIIYVCICWKLYAESFNNGTHLTRDDASSKLINIQIHIHIYRSTSMLLVVAASDIVSRHRINTDSESISALLIHLSIYVFAYTHTNKHFICKYAKHFKWVQRINAWHASVSIKSKCICAQPSDWCAMWWQMSIDWARMRIWLWKYINTTLATTPYIKILLSQLYKYYLRFNLIFHTIFKLFCSPVTREKKKI